MPRCQKYICEAAAFNSAGSYEYKENTPAYG